MNHPNSFTPVHSAFQHVRRRLLESRTPDGYWDGELSASALSTATAVSTLSFYLKSTDSRATETNSLIGIQIEAGIGWIMQQQNDDGGWGDTPKSYSNISTTMLVVAALTAADRHQEFSNSIRSAESYIEQQGGIVGLKKRYGIDKTFAVPILANCAMAGIVPWKEVSALPFEAACVPQRFYNLMQLPVVSYAIPALVAIGQVKFHFDPPWNPIMRMVRKASVNRSLRVLERMMPSSGGFLEAVPLTSFVSMALINCGRHDHAVVKQGIRFLIESYRAETDTVGSWPIDTNLATWNTTLSINALANGPQHGIPDFEASEERNNWRSCLEWLLACQNTTIHPFTGAAPGGWGWSDLSGAVPDADDTPGALIALKNLNVHLDQFVASTELEAIRNQIMASKDLGIKWLVELQNRDRGWPTFCRGWGKLPFDRSGTDITAHAIRGLLAWQNESNVQGVRSAIERGFAYLRANQQKDGSWLPLWFGNQDHEIESNPCYGTAKVLMAYRDAEAFDTNEARIGLKWIRDNQNPDGGWGGGASLSWSDSQLGTSSVEETALCTELLLEDSEPSSQEAATNGIHWLVRAVESGLIETSWPIGFYFARLWYYEKMYPLVFATSALGAALNKQLGVESGPEQKHDQRS